MNNISKVRGREEEDFGDEWLGNGQKEVGKCRTPGPAVPRFLHVRDRFCSDLNIFGINFGGSSESAPRRFALGTAALSRTRRTLTFPKENRLV